MIDNSFSTKLNSRSNLIFPPCFGVEVSIHDPLVALELLDESEINSDDLNFIQLATVNGRRHMNKLPLKVFRKLLADHFDIRFRQKTLKWPRRLRHLPKL